MNDQLKKELLNLLKSENRLDGELEDMTPIMREIYCWGLSNITNKEMKRIIKLYKKFNLNFSQGDQKWSPYFF